MLAVSPVRYVDANGAAINKFTAFVGASCYQPSLVFGQTVAYVKNGEFVGSGHRKAG